MAKDSVLEAQDLDRQVTALNAQSKEPWVLENGRLHRRYKFSNFSTAFAFMVQVAMICEAMDHHPRWTNVWNVVEIDLLTHRARGITLLDIEMAAEMEQIARQYLL